MRPAQAGPSRPFHATLRDALDVIFVRKWLLLAAFGVPLLIGAVLAANTTRVFVAEARLLVQPGSQSVLQPGAGRSASGDRDQVIRSELAILRSDVLRVATLRRLGVERVYPSAASNGEGWRGALAAIPVLGSLFAFAPTPQSADNEASASARLALDLTASSVAQSNMIRLTYRHGDRELAADVLNTLIAVYIERRAEIFKSSRVDPNAAQREQYAARLRSADDELQRFDDVNCVSNAEERRAALLRDQAALATDQQLAEARMATLGVQIEALRRQATRLAPPPSPSADAKGLATAATVTDRLLALEGTRRDLMGRDQPEGAAIAELDRQIAAARAQLSHPAAPATPATAPPPLARRPANPVYVEVTAQLAKAESERDALAGQRADMTVRAQEVQDGLSQLVAAVRRYGEMKKARDELDLSYRTLVRNGELARVVDELERGPLENIRVVQQAEPPRFGSGSPAMQLGAGALFGVLAAAGAFFLSGAVRPTIFGASDVERLLQLPVLAVVAEASPRSELSSSRWHGSFRKFVRQVASAST